MGAVTMTIGQALAELKMLTKRINRAIAGATYLYVVAANDDAKEQERLKKEGKAEWQSVNALMDRYFRIKRLVLLSNSETTITVGPRTMTVAEAIELKSKIPWHTSIATTLKTQFDACNLRVKKHNDALEERAAQLFKNEEGKVDQVMLDTYVNSRKASVVGVDNPATKVLEFIEFLDVFNRNIDAALNASNALTTITVDGEEAITSGE